MKQYRKYQKQQNLDQATRDFIDGRNWLTRVFRKHRISWCEMGLNHFNSTIPILLESGIIDISTRSIKDRDEKTVMNLVFVSQVMNL
jgi:hypothetical protein